MKIAFSDIFVGHHAGQGFQALCSVDGFLELLDTRLQFSKISNGLLLQQEPYNQAVKVLEETFMLGFFRWHKTRLDAQIQTQAYQFAKQATIAVAAPQLQAVVHLQVLWSANPLPGHRLRRRLPSSLSGSSPLWNASCPTTTPFTPKRRHAWLLFEFIEGWHNPHKRHSALDYLSPNWYEDVHKST